jgi:hypothetical protein
MGYQLIETVTVGSGGAASIEFTGIPQDGVDLVLLVSGRGSKSATSDNFDLVINSATTTLSGIYLRGTSTTVQTASSFEIRALSAANTTASTFGSTSVTFSNYTSSTDKAISVDSVTENNAGNQYDAFQSIAAGSVVSSSPITNLELTNSSSFEQYSTASLYKITAD